MSFSASISELVKNSTSPLLAIAPHWERVELHDVAAILNGYPWKSAYFNDQIGVPVIRIRDVTSGNTETKYRGEIVDGYWIENGDLLVGMDGDFNIRVWDGGPALLNQRVCRVLSDKRFYLPELLVHVLPGYLQLVHDETHSVTVKHLSSKTLADIPLPLPPLPEQKRIVAKIGSLSSKSRRAHDHLDHVPRLVEKYKQSVLATAFRGGLQIGVSRAKANTNNSVTSDISEILSAHKALKAPNIHDQPEELFQIPSDWSWVPASWVVRPGAEIVYGIVQPGPKLASGVPYVRGTDIEDGRIKLDQLLFTSPEIAKRYERASLLPGDVLLGIIRATKVAVVPEELAGGNITQGTARFRPSKLITTSYLAHWLNSPTAQTWLHSKYRGIDMPGLNLRDVRQLPVPLAPIETQEQICIAIDRAFSWIERLAAEANGAKKLMENLDQAVLAKAFRGDLVPQDPSDEPAERLLQQITAERAMAPKAKRGRSRKE